MNRLSTLPVLFALALSLPGCIDGDLELFADHPGADVDVYSDGTQVRVLGCSDSAVWFGCNPAQPGERMTVIAGDRWIETTPNAGTGEPLVDEIMSLFHGGTLAITTDAPPDGIVGIEIAGTAVDVPLRAPVAVLSPSRVSRAQLVPIVYEPMPDAARSIAIVDTRCIGNGDRTQILEIEEPGRIDLDLANQSAPGDCTHDVHIDQLTPVNGVDLITITRLSFSSEP